VCCVVLCCVVLCCVVLCCVGIFGISILMGYPTTRSYTSRLSKVLERAGIELWDIGPSTKVPFALPSCPRSISAAKIDLSFISGMSMDYKLKLG
jgi:hypothetical protein